MPKLKTKSGAKKRFRMTATGKVRMNQAYKRHGMRKRPQDMIRSARGTTTLCDADASIIKRNFFGKDPPLFDDLRNLLICSGNSDYALVKSGKILRHDLRSVALGIHRDKIHVDILATSPSFSIHRPAS